MKFVKIRYLFSYMHNAHTPKEINYYLKRNQINEDTVPIL